MPILYTIGHSNHPADRFVDLLRLHGVTRLVDVRSHPYSRWAPQYRRRQLAEALACADVDYVFLGDTLGGRPAAAEYHDTDGNVDYEARRQAADFLAGIETLRRLATERRTVMMCAEEDPARCHRRLLITPPLLVRDPLRQRIEVAHIRGDGRLQPESGIRAGDGQLGLFS